MASLLNPTITWPFISTFKGYTPVDVCCFCIAGVFYDSGDAETTGYAFDFYDCYWCFCFVEVDGIVAVAVVCPDD